MRHAASTSSVLVWLSLTPVLLWAGTDVDESRPASADAVVKVINTRGEVDITGWAEQTVSVSGELDDLAEGFVFEVDGREVLIEVKMPRRNVNWGDGSKLTIKVPEGSRVQFEGVSTDVVVANVSGGSHIRTVSGGVEVSRIAEQLIVNSVSGDIEAKDVTGRVRLATISGDMELELGATDVEVDTVSGDVDLDMKAFDAVLGKSVSGEIEVAGELLPRGRVDLTSVSGDIDLDLTKPVNARVVIRAGFGGEIDNRLDETEPKNIFPSQQELETVLGDGSGHVRISTVSADIRLN